MLEAATWGFFSIGSCQPEPTPNPRPYPWGTYVFVPKSRTNGVLFTRRDKVPIGYQAEQKEVNQKRKEADPIYPSPGNLDILANVGNRSRGRYPPPRAASQNLTPSLKISVTKVPHWAPRRAAPPLPHNQSGKRSSTLLIGNSFGRDA